MKYFGPISLICIHLGHSYKAYSKCLPPHKPAPNSMLTCSCSMTVYPKDSPAPMDLPSSSAALHKPVLLKDEYWTFAPAHQPENTYHGQYLVPIYPVVCRLYISNPLGVFNSQGLYRAPAMSEKCWDTLAPNSRLAVPRFAQSTMLVPMDIFCACVSFK